MPGGVIERVGPHGLVERAQPGRRIGGCLCIHDRRLREPEGEYNQNAAPHPLSFGAGPGAVKR
jgi:hypothetical protein